MSLFEILIIAVLIFFQSIFGIGLLLFGTPTFLLLGYNFLDVLNILLPISITISAIQFFSSDVKNKEFKYNFNCFCLPPLILALYFIINFLDKINFELYIAILIISFAILSLNKKKIKYLKNFTLFKQRLLLSIIGLIHGVSNLGGSLLAILSPIINNEEKNKTRYSIAYGYLIMGIIQILVLFFFSNNHIKYFNLIYIILVFIIYFPTQKIFKKFKSNHFSNFLNIFALLYGLIILFKNI
jgi:uncharacterized protein